MRWIKVFRLRLRSLLRSGRVEQELDEELRYHLERQIEENLAAGMSPEGARYSALRAMGGIEQRKEECRDARGWGFVDRLTQDLRYAARTLRRAPAFTLLAVSTLAIGIGATTAIFTVVYSVLLRPLPFPDSDHLVAVWERPPGSERRNPASLRNVLAWKERNHTIEAMAALREMPMNLLGDEPIQVTGAAVGADFFRVLGVAPLLGRTFVPDEDLPSAPRTLVLTYGFWQRHFGGRPDVIGQRISVNVSHHEIIGVMPPDLGFPSGVELFTTLRDSPDEGRNYSTIARLRKGATLSSARADISAIAAQTAVEHPEANARWGATVVPLTEQIVGPVRLPLLVLLAGVGFVLLIACANVANLLLMRSAERAREMSIRRALGAGRFRLLHQVLVEGLLLASIGGLCGLALAHWGVRALVLTLPAAIPLPRLQEIAIDASVLVFTAVVSLGAGVLASLAPALQANRADVARELHQSGRSVTATQRRLRGAMVVAEVALALPLLAGAGLMVRSFLRLSAVEPGFRVEGVLTARMLLLPVRDRAYHAQFVDQVLQRIRALPQVVAAGSIGILPMTGINSGSWYYRADQPEPPRSERPSGDISIVSTGYLQAMGIPVLKGRDFDERDRIGSPHVAMLNETAARRLFGNGEALGRRLTVSWNDAREVEIVGVVRDIRHSQLQTEPEPCLFLPNDQQPFPLSSLVVRTAGNPLALVAAVKEQVRQVDSDQGIAEIRTLEQLVASAMARPRVQTALGGLLSIVALILAVVGIYGVIAQSVGQRTREIGIRFALGASRRSIFTVVLHEGLSLTAVGLVIGVGASVGLTRYIRRLLFEVGPLDPIVFAAVNALMLIVAAAACATPAARAARVDPAVILKEE
jgi:predicted permease